VPRYRRGPPVVARLTHSLLGNEVWRTITAKTAVRSHSDAADCSHSRANPAA